MGGKRRTRQQPSDESDSGIKGKNMATLMDPTSERSPMIRPRLERPKSLEGLIVGIMDISKPRGDVFLDRLGMRLTERGITVKRYAKPTMTRPAPLALRQQMGTEIHVMIEGLAD
jgi:hypothetical protein